MTPSTSAVIPVSAAHTHAVPLNLIIWFAVHPMLEKSRSAIVPSRILAEVTAPVARSAVAMVPSTISDEMMSVQRIDEIVYPAAFDPEREIPVPATLSNTSLPMTPSTSAVRAAVQTHTGMAQTHCDTSTSPTFQSLEFGERGHRRVRRQRLSIVIFVESCVPISTV